MPIDIILELLPVLLPLILECFQRDGEDATVKRLRAAGPLVQWRLYRAYRGNGCSPSCARKHAREVCADLRNCSEQDLREVLQEAMSGE